MRNRVLVTSHFQSYKFDTIRLHRLTYHDEDGKPIPFVSTYRDDSTRHQKEEVLEHPDEALYQVEMFYTLEICL